MIFLLSNLKLNSQLQGCPFECELNSRKYKFKIFNMIDSYTLLFPPKAR